MMNCGLRMISVLLWVVAGQWACFGSGQSPELSGDVAPSVDTSGRNSLADGKAVEVFQAFGDAEQPGDPSCARPPCPQDGGNSCDLSGDCDAPDFPETCNGSLTNCDKAFNQVSQVCTHNAFSSVERGFVIPTPNQKYGLERQLDDGVRCLMLDIYSSGGDLKLCHGACELGDDDLHAALVEIRDWLDDHPSEVVSLILETYVDEELIQAALVESGLVKKDEAASEASLLYFHNQEAGSPWPTLREMVNLGQRLVVFSDLDSANGTWNLDWRRYGWETPFNDDSFTCAPGRGDPLAYDNQIFILNHYTLCSLGGCVETSEENNDFEFLFSRASECSELHPDYNPWGQIPTFVNVDNYHLPWKGGFTNRPDVFDVVDALNALSVSRSR